MTRPLLLLLLVIAGCSGGEPRPTGGPTGRSKTVDGLLFIEISPGTFRMGTDVLGEGVMARWSVLSTPVHPVTIAKPIWVATTEVPNWLYRKFRPDFKPAAASPGPDHPAVGMTQAAAKAFCAWLTENNPGTFRLPSEAEWEYLCRAGSTTIYSFGDEEAEVPKHAWTEVNAGGSAHPVGGLSASAWGLFDFHGNAFEWTADTWHGNYRSAPADGSAWVDELSKRTVVRGGSYADPASHVRAGLRTRENGGDDEPGYPVGIRVVGEL